MITLTSTLPETYRLVSIHHSSNDLYHVYVMTKRADNGHDCGAIGVDKSLANAAHFAVERCEEKLRVPEYDPRHWVSKEPIRPASLIAGLNIDKLDL